jgi:hypothetical protein
LKAPPADHDTIKSYLLGQMPEEDEAQFEARLLTDREFYEELSIVEDELIDHYLRGALSDSDRQSFESYFVSSDERWQKVRFAKALRKYVSGAGERNEPNTASQIDLVPAEVARPRLARRPSFFSFRRPLFVYALTAAILIIVGGIFWLGRNAGPSGGEVLAIELISTPATRGGNDVKQFKLTPDIETVRLQLDLPKNEYPSYEAVLLDSSLRPVLTGKNLKPQTLNSFAVVILDVKASLLSPDDYRIQLSGTTPGGRSESLATFFFKIPR